MMRLLPTQFFRYFLLGLLLTLACGTRAQSRPPADYNILDFGAVARKGHNSQAAIQRALDACGRAGGGRVVVPPGTFSTATIRLRSNVELHLSSGATLFALPDSTAYTNTKVGLEDAGDSFIPGLIVAQNVNNISLTGAGSVVGEPRFFSVLVEPGDAYPGWNTNAQRAGVPLLALRVRDPKISLVYISGCRNVTLRDVSISNSPNWSCHIQWSQDVVVRGVRISSSLEKGVNSDGLDIDGCKRVLVSDCIIRTGDDAICLKTTKQGGRSETCEDITVTNCVLASTSCALKIGTESNADFRRILFTNCTISDSNRALGIIVRDGATVEQVVFSNIVLDCRRKPFFWWGNGEAFHFTVFKRNPDSRLGRIRDVRIQGLSGKVEGTSNITGFAGPGEEAYSSISNVKLEDIRLTMRPESEPDKRATNGIEVSNAEQITLRDVAVAWNAAAGAGEPLWQHGLALRTVRDFRIENFVNTAANSNHQAAPLALENVQNGQLTVPEAPASRYADITGATTRAVRVRANRRGATRVTVGRDARGAVQFHP